MAVSNPDGGLPLSYSIITSRLIDGIGVQSVIDAGLVDPTHNGVGLIVTLSPDGYDVTEHSLWWIGPNTTLKIQAFNTWPDVGEDTALVLSFNPQELFFYPNSSTTQWVDGKEAILRNDIVIECGDPQLINNMKFYDWVYRYAIITTNNIRQAKIVLHILPISMSTLDSLTDPLSPDLCVRIIPIISAPWAHPPDQALMMQGPIPVFRDRRAAEAKVLMKVPPSQTIKKFVRRVLLSCSSNPELTNDELADLLSDPTKHPPSRPAIIATWPDLMKDTTIPSTPKVGLTPAQASSQTRGAPVIAMDQSALNKSAQQSLSFQSGRAMDEDFTEPPSISTEAKNRQDLLLNMFDGDLPPNLPSWQMLSEMPLSDCIAVVSMKKERARESSEVGSEAEAFKKATTPVVYDTVQVDDCLTKLHSARFLRAPLSEPPVYWSLLKKKLEQVVTILPEAPFGVDNHISDVAIKKMSDRTAVLQLKHILKSNSHVEKSAPVSKRRAVESTGFGETCELSYVNDFDYKSARFPWEIIEALSAAASVNQQLWPLDYGFLNTFRCLIRFQLFHDDRISTKLQLLICKDFVDGVFLANSRKARCQLPPLSLKQCDNVALETLRTHKRPQQLPSTLDLAASKGKLLPGQDPESFTAFSHTNLARGQRETQATVQRNQLQRYGNGGSSKASGRFGNSAQHGMGNRPTQSSGIQVCPAFSRGIPCVRGGDASGSCKAVNGTILHHVCSICLKSNHGRDNHK